ncbi:helix-turn-helix transcriptional regulator [Bradyrhizobium sp. WSM 1738]|uniref:helix-turn-helix domain-containing protein n=1 Tax=Bradyrhizobium hereditatis TaxID=2821405 RepID=UPI001CE31D1B|nr:XRE family transcriptional regulator [Bradyrhizobium hereditatis]MCA6113649.1 helix-turn-helix transcriptional regulator [Bradyrhizobium hereditatis]
MVSAEAGRRAREAARLAGIGAVIRRARSARGLTLDELAGMVGLSVTFLSRIERGLIACSIGNLLEIAGVLQLPPAELFADIEGEDRTRAYRVVRSIDAVPAKGADANYAWCKLASGMGEQRLETFLLELSAKPHKPTLVAHPGEEMCFVLEGSVEFQVGDETIALERGDSIHLRSDVPHMAWARGSGTARLLMVTSIENQSAIAVEWWSNIAGRKGEREKTAKGRAK